MHLNPNSYILFLLALLLPGCIEEFTPKDVDEISDMLVVEGTISGDSNTVIKLSRSVGLLSESTYNPVSGATVRVARSDGWISDPGAETETGEYQVYVGELDTSLSYHLVMYIGGKEYRSTESQPIITPEIDSVIWKNKGEGEPITIHVTTHDNSRDVGYYHWAYKEDWEVHASYFANADYNVETGVYTPYSSNGLNTYYCWGNAKSQTLLLEDTEKLTGNLIYEKKLTTIPATDERISYLYSILVTQWAVSKSCYHYFSNLQNNIDEAGSIFAPQPSELPGNITCVTDASEVVIGYVDVATATEKRIFISKDEIEDSSYKPLSCSIVEVPEGGSVVDTMKLYGLVVYNVPEDLKYGTLTEKACVDCRLKGSKTKPDFWPNDHQ